MRFSRCYLEITNRCNLACSFCPKTKRPARTLTAEEFRLLAGKLRAYTDYLYLHVMGEPLLHPALPELLGTGKVRPACKPRTGRFQALPCWEGPFVLEL